MAAVAGVVLALLWAWAAIAKLRTKGLVADDLANLGIPFPRGAALVLIAGELLLSAASLFATFVGDARAVVGLVSTGVIVLFTLTFPVRAARTDSTECSCLGIQTSDATVPTRVDVQRAAMRPLVHWVRNGAFATASLVLAEAAYLVIPAIVLLAAVLVVAEMVVVARDVRANATTPHPDLRVLRRRQVKAFAQAWHTGLWIPHIMCAWSHRREASHIEG